MLRRFLSQPRKPVVRGNFLPRLEGLEERWVPATASFSKGTLTVTAASGDLALDFFQDGTRPIGHITVEDDGVAIFNDPAGSAPTKLVKNIVVKIPAAVTTIDVNFDTLILVGNLTINSNATNGVNVDLNVVDITKNFRLTCSGTTANDTLNLDGSLVEGTTTALLGQGANQTTVTDCFLRGDVLVTGKGGTDDVDVETTHMEGLATFNLGSNTNQLDVINGTSSADIGLAYTGGNGNDIVNVVTGNLHTGSGTFNLGDGSNQLNLTPAVSSTFGNNLNISGGIGVDDVSISDVVVGGSLNVKLSHGTGTQSLDLTDVTVQKALNITGGAQVDDVTLQGVAVTGATTILLLDNNDSLDIDDSLFVGTALFEGGNGNDTFLIEDDILLTGVTSFGGKFTIKGGNDDDTLTLGAGAPNPNTTLTINGATTVWNGGPGINTFTNTLGPAPGFNDNGTPPTNNWV